MFEDKTVLVVGGAGFIGSNLLNRLLNTEATIKATLHESEPQIIDDRIEYLYGDLSCKQSCEYFASDVDYVFMCAANTSGAAVMEKTPLVHVTPNVVMNTLMLDAAYSCGVEKFLFISSNTVYPESDLPMKENQVTNEFFHKYYCVAWMKRFTEILCDMYTNRIKKPMQTIIVRPANSYGPYDDFEWETSHVIPALIRKVVERHDPIEVWGDGSDLKDFIYVEDLVDGLVNCMDSVDSSSATNVVNLASGEVISIRAILNNIIAADGYNGARIQFNSDKPTMISKRVLDTDLADSMLNFKATTPIDVGLRKTIQWYRRKHAS